MEFLKTINDEKVKIDRKLKGYFANLVKNESDSSLKDYYERLRNFIYPESGSPAKRIRPIVLIHSFFGCATDNKVDNNLDEIRDLSLSIELMHNASLIHDDVCEQAPDRRGFPTFHKSMATLFEEKNQNKYGNPSLWGNSMAIHGGDISFSLGGSIIMNTKFPSKKKFMAIEEYLKGYSGVVRGKVIEQYLETISLENSTLEDYLLMAESKTSQLFITAGLIGCILAEGRSAQMEPLKRAMKSLGVSYQIKYDIVDTFNESKSNALHLDIKNRKRTILAISAFKNSKGKNREKFDKIFNSNHPITDDEVEIIKEIMIDTNALDFAKMYQQQQKQQAEIELDLIYPGLRDETQEFFKNLFDFSVVK